jgi:uncharacterized protein (DUF433 family)
MREDITMPAVPVPGHDRITRDPEVLVGKPIIQGTRISVELILGKLANEPDFQILLEDYPRLTIEDIQACLRYARDLVVQQHQLPVDPEVELGSRASA